MERKSITILALVVSLLIIFLTYNNIYSNNEIYKILKAKNFESDKIESSSLPNKNTKESKNSNSRNAFFDLGANRGDSIENFIGITKKGDGGNIRNKIPSERINQKWSIYGIEGNSKFDKNLLDIKEKYSSDQYNIIIYNSTIVTTYDGKIKFYLDKNDRFGNNVGSSIKENHPDVILSKKVYEEKPCVDFARLLREYN